MGILSGIGFGEYHYRHDTARAVDGLGRILNPGSTQVTKQTRQIVADFVRGEVSEGSCSKTTGECAVKSTGTALVVDGQTLASRSAPGSDLVKVCIPVRTKYDISRDEKTGKETTKENQNAKEVKAAASVLMRVLGTGIGVRTAKGGDRILTSGSMRRQAGRVMVPGECVTVRITSDMRDVASDMMTARAQVTSSLPAGEKATRGKVRAQARKIRKERAAAREAAMKEKRLAALAKARAARSEAAAAKKAAAEAKKAGDTAEAKAATADAKKAEATAKAAESTAKKAATAAKKAASAKKAPAKKGGKKAAAKK